MKETRQQFSSSIREKLVVDFRDFVNAKLSTPAFVYDRVRLEENAKLLAELASKTGIKFTYSIKACAIDEVLRILIPYITGFSASSLFEARLCREVIDEDSRGKSIHIASPAYIHADFPEVIDICDFISFNSIGQALSLAPQVEDRISCGLRINPDISFITDERYDPCRKHSKLGTPIDNVEKVWHEQPGSFAALSGLHFHTNSASADFEQLFNTIKKVKEKLPDLLQQITWLNMGGGYFYDHSHADFVWFGRIRELLSNSQPLSLFMEPGEFLVGSAGYLVSRVVDIFQNASRQIAVLDTSINHLPECFEYQFEPDVLNAVEDSEFEYILAGASCLSGDLFGVYCFPDKLAVGDLVVFSDVGAYSVVKANTFTGIPLPSIYVREPNGAFTLQTKYPFSLYRQLWRRQ